MKYYPLSQSDHDRIISTLEKRDGPIINTYYYTLVDIITLSLQCFHRVTATRIDLRYPQSLTADDMPCIDISIRDDAMTRFCKSLQAKLNSLVNRKRKQGDRVRDHTFHYLWVRELHQSNYPHYHVLLLFCKDTFYTTGRYDDPDSLAGLITAAWASACGVYINHKTDPALFSLFTGSVYFAKQGTYHLDINADSNALHASITELLLRAGYLAKQATTIKATTIGIDLTKEVFQVHGGDEYGKRLFNKQLKRSQIACIFRPIMNTDSGPM